MPRVVMSLSQQAFAKGRDENNFKKNGQLLFNYFLLSASCSSEWSRSLKGWTVCFVRDVSLAAGSQFIYFYSGTSCDHRRRLICCL